MAKKDMKLSWMMVLRFVQNLVCIMLDDNKNKSLAEVKTRCHCPVTGQWSPDTANVK
jgi:hypothetical protein